MEKRTFVHISEYFLPNIYELKPTYQLGHKLYLTQLRQKYTERKTSFCYVAASSPEWESDKSATVCSYT